MLQFFTLTNKAFFKLKLGFRFSKPVSLCLLTAMAIPVFADSSNVKFDESLEEWGSLVAATELDSKCNFLKTDQGIRLQSVRDTLGKRLEAQDPTKFTQFQQLMVDPGAHNFLQDVRQKPCDDEALQVFENWVIETFKRHPDWD